MNVLGLPKTVHNRYVHHSNVTPSCITLNKHHGLNGEHKEDIFTLDHVTLNEVVTSSFWSSLESTETLMDISKSRNKSINAVVNLALGPKQL